MPTTTTPTEPSSNANARQRLTAVMSYLLGRVTGPG
jgi:hypothetical protein